MQAGPGHKLTVVGYGVIEWISVLPEMPIFGFPGAMKAPLTKGEGGPELGRDKVGKWK